MNVDFGGGELVATVRKWKHDQHKNPVVISGTNPLRYARIYEVDFPYGTVKEFSDNLVSKNFL